MTRIVSFDEARKLYDTRYTADHTPDWVKRAETNGGFMPVSYSDIQWYSQTKFPGEGDVPLKARYFETSINGNKMLTFF